MHQGAQGTSEKPHVAQADEVDARTAWRTKPAQPAKSGPRDPFLPLGCLREKASVACGLACLLAWAELLLCFEGVLRDEVELAGGLVHDPFFRAATATAAVLFLAAAALARVPQVAGLTKALADGRHALVAMAALGAASSAAPALLAHLAPGCAWAPALCGVGAGTFVTWGTLAWGRLLARLDLRCALLLVAGACCLQWLPFVCLPALGFAAKAVLVAALALATCWCLDRSRASEGLLDATAPTSRHPGAAGGPEPGRGRTLAAMSATMLAFSLVIQFMWCFFIKMLPGRLDPALFPGIFAVVIVAGVAVTLGAVAVMERQRAYRLELFYRVMMLLCLCGVAATGVAAANASTAQLFAMYALVYLGYSLLGPTMWLLSLGYAHMCRQDVVRVLGCVFGLKYLGLFGGFSAMDAMVASGLASQGPDLLPSVILTCVAVLACAYLLVFPERELLSLSPLLFGMSSESVETRCRQIAAERGLTPRETEVFTLLARGRDVGYICQTLFIARNTANVHRKSIYAKLDIHSQQELLTLVEGGE